MFNISLRPLCACAHSHASVYMHAHSNLQTHLHTNAEKKKRCCIWDGWCSYWEVGWALSRHLSSHALQQARLITQSRSWKSGNSFLHHLNWLLFCCRDKTRWPKATYRRTSLFCLTAPEERESTVTERHVGWPEGQMW